MVSFLTCLSCYILLYKPKVILNGNSSDIKYLEAGVPQGFVLGPLLVLLYINDFCNHVLSEDFMFADDMSVFKHIRNNMHHVASVENRLVVRRVCMIGVSSDL